MTTRWQIKHMGKNAQPHAIREFQITTMTYKYIPIKMVKIQEIQDGRGVKWNLN